MLRENWVSLPWQSPFREGFGFAVKRRGDELDLYPEEMGILSERAVPKRRTEFALGRSAAHSALAQLGIAHFPILRSVHNEPLWPQGVAGAISHCADIAVAAAAFYRSSAGIGIDLEQADREVSRDIGRLVCTPREMEWVKDAGDQLGRLLAIFSAKESVFKAFFPQEKIFLDFSDAQLLWDNAGQKFDGYLLKSAGKNYPAGYRFHVDYRRWENYIFTFLTLPPHP